VLPAHTLFTGQRERLNFYACKGAHTLFTSQRGREREKGGGKERKEEGKRESEKVRKRERKGEGKRDSEKEGEKGRIWLF